MFNQIIFFYFPNASKNGAIIAQLFQGNRGLKILGHLDEFPLIMSLLYYYISILLLCWYIIIVLLLSLSFFIFICVNCINFGKVVLVLFDKELKKISSFFGFFNFCLKLHLSTFILKSLCLNFQLPVSNRKSQAKAGQI